MAKIQVTTTDTNSFLNAARTVFRDSGGIPYTLSLDETSDYIELYIGDAATDPTFSLLDSLTAESAPIAISGAMDSTDTLHICWLDPGLGKATPLRYSTIDLTAGTPTFTTPTSVVVDIGETPTSTSLYTAIAIDSNNVPHIVYNEYPKIGGATTYAAMYINKVGGSWNTKVNVLYVQNIDASKLKISIDLDNLPYIVNSPQGGQTYGAVYIGGANNATSFTATTTIGTSNDLDCDICVDTEGNHYVVMIDLGGGLGLRTLMVRKHTYGTSWSTWSAAVESDENLPNAPNSVSVVPVGSDIYAFYKSNDDNIAYDKYDGSSWAGETVLETGTFNSVRAKWGFWVDNDSAGSLFENIISEISSSSATIYNIHGATGTQEKIGVKLISKLNAGTLYYILIGLEKQGSPTDDLVVKLYTGGWETTLVATSDNVAASGIDGNTKFTFSTPPTLTGSTTYYFVLERSGSRDTSNYCWSLLDQNSDSNIVAGYADSGLWIDNASDEQLRFTIYQRTTPAELDYAFVDEETSPDIWWNTLSLSVATEWTTKSLKYYNGSWVTKPLKAYIASSWTTVPLKVNI